MNTKHITADYFQSETITDLIQSLVKFQIAFDNASLKKDRKNEHLRNQYVSLDNLLHVIRSLLSDCGLVVIQSLAGDYLTTVLYHTSGQYIGSNMPFNPMNGNKGTNALQELGGGITYAKRYSLSALLQISVDIDTDANESKITNQQLTKIVKKKVETMAQVNKLVDWVLEDITRREKLTDVYEISKPHLEYIDYEIQTRS